MHKSVLMTIYLPTTFLQMEIIFVFPCSLFLTTDEVEHPQFVQNYHWFLFYLVHLPVSFLDFLIWSCHIYLLWIIPGLYSHWWPITPLKYRLGKKETCMYYLASVIAFSVFLELLWRSTLLICYRLNRFQCPQVNQFDICELLFLQVGQIHTILYNGIHR